MNALLFWVFLLECRPMIVFTFFRALFLLQGHSDPLAIFPAGVINR